MLHLMIEFIFNTFLNVFLIVTVENAIDNYIELKPRNIEFFAKLKLFIVKAFVDVKPNIVDASIDVKPSIVGFGVSKLGDNEVDAVTSYFFTKDT